MESLVYQVISNELSNTLKSLSNHYGIDMSEASCLLKHHVTQYQATSISLPPINRCQARIWNGGISDRCHRSHGRDTMYCRYHGMIPPSPLCIKCTEYYGENRYHNYQWEHLGNINQKIPKFFRN